MSWNPLTWGKKEQEKEYPKRIRVRPTDIAKWKNVNDDRNLIIEVVEGENNVVDSHGFTKELLDSMSKEMELPIEFKDVEEEEFELFEGIDLNLTRYR